MGRVNDDMHFGGTLSADVVKPSAGCLLDTHISASCNADPVKFRRRVIAALHQSGTMATDAGQLIYTYRPATNGVIKDVRAVSKTVCTVDATCTIDVLKDGVTVLVAAIVLDSGNAAYTPEAGTIDVSAIAQNECLEVTVTAAAGGGVLGTELLVQVEIEEAMA